MNLLRLLSPTPLDGFAARGWGGQGGGARSILKFRLRRGGFTSMLGPVNV